MISSLDGGDDLLDPVNAWELTFEGCYLTVDVRQFDLQLFAIVVHSFAAAVFVAAVGGDSLVFYGLRGWAEMHGWLSVDALIGKTAMVDAVVKAVLLEGAVLELIPTFSPLLQLVFVVPVSVLFAESVPLDVAHGEKDMGVVVPTVAASGWGVDRNVRDHALVDEGTPERIPGRARHVARA